MDKVSSLLSQRVGDVLRRRFALILIALWAPAHCAFADPTSANDVAHSILYNANGRPVREAFNSALEERFPVGSSLSVLANFFQKLGGFCAKNSDGLAFRCEADVEACRNTIIARVEAKDDVITRIQTIELALKTCN